ncbi:MAG: lipoate--protein ligase family protein [Thermoplasmatales archaeon]|nr:lipoate--protein ligase family protein [Thermoplasmatales archaeon]
MDFRLILDSHRSAFSNMAIDEAILRIGKPTLRLYKWNPSAISIGYFQSIEEEVNIPVCKREGIDVVRRITGGGAVYHDCEGEITYSFVSPVHFLPERTIDIYRVICSSIANGLNKIGVGASLSGINDIVVNGKKISGSAQTKRDKKILQHGTILVRVNVEKMFSLLKISKEKISDKEIKRVEDRVTSIERELGYVSNEKIIDAIIDGFAENMKIDFYKGEFEEEEINLAKILEEKYASKEWNFKR